MKREHPMPAEITADLIAHELDPAAYTYLDERTPKGNGAIAVAKRSAFPTRRAVFATWPRPTWLLKVSGRYVCHAGTDTSLLFDTPGAALAHQEPQP